MGHLRKIDSMCLPRAYDVDIRSGESYDKISPFRQPRNFLSLPVPGIFCVKHLCCCNTGIGRTDPLQEEHNTIQISEKQSIKYFALTEMARKVN